MLLKRVITALVIFVTLCYVAGVFNLAFVFVLSFAGLCYVPVFLAGAYIIQRIAGGRIRKKFEKHQISFHLIIVGSLVLLLLGRHVINRHYMPGVFYLIRISAKVGLLVVTILYGWSFLKNGWCRKTITWTVVYLLFIFVPVIIASVRISSEQQVGASAVNQLAGIGYLDWVPADGNISKVSVNLYNPELSCNGLNLYSRRSPGEILLMDMEGKILHNWQLDKKNEYNGVWPYAQILENGDLLSYCMESIFVRLGWNSTRKWGAKMRAHHGFYVSKNEDIYALNRRDSVIFRSGLPVPVLEDYITIFSKDGDLKGDISFIDAAKSELPSKVILEIYRYIARPGNLWKILTRMFTGEPVFISSSGALDILHVNSAIVIERDIDGLCKKGGVLISMRNLDLIVIFDIEKEKFVWKWGPGIIDDQHDAKMLDNDNILLFDNGYNRGYSRIIELNALTGEIVWEYKAKKPEDFHSPRRGSCQRLPNGNTLITESDRGRIFEVTYSGETVWEFYNPEVNEDTRERKAFRKLTRIPDITKFSLPGEVGR